MASVLQDKAAYLALHPELRQALSEAELRSIEPALEKISNLLVFEKLAGGRLPTETKSESFEFTSYEFSQGGKRMKLGSPRNAPEYKMEEKQHDVTLTRPFEMQVTLVTQLQWLLVMGENPSNFKTGGQVIKINGRDIEINPDRPVEQVSWDDVQKYIQKLNAADPHYNYRLPTEAEWEYSVRAGTDTPYSYGSDPGELCAYGWHKANSGNQTHDVASLKPNAKGLYDMHGNVQEWVQDWWEIDHSPYAVDPIGPSQGRHGVVRGGDWNDDARRLRSACRVSRGHDLQLNFVGFRLVRTAR